MYKKAFHGAAEMRSNGALELLVSFGWIALFFALQTVVALIWMRIFGPYDVKLTQLIDPSTMTLSQLANYSSTVFQSLLASGLTLMLLISFYLTRFNRTKTMGLDVWGNANVRTITICVLIIIAAMIFQGVYQTFLPNVKMQEHMRMLVTAMPDDLLSKLTLFFAIAVMAGLTEEILFRGFLQNAVGRYVNFHLAIILSALIFALVHGQPEAFIPLAVLGGAFGYVYHITKSLRLAILLHILNNSAALIFSEIAEKSVSPEKSIAVIGPLLGL